MNSTFRNHVCIMENQNLLTLHDAQSLPLYYTYRGGSL
jgi:hypothetical protein